uniref:NADH dehydrogenase subunit 2 n=1 Tax=Myra affinis TaxID=2800677 RepID=UPI001FAF4A79|nr:NADH dehydrogenase subunit 2 [Myra affinis]UJP67369.1 NADH dehydrogenase subunit 2 [Myra affinis]
MVPPSYLLFMFTLLLGSFMSISSSSWLAAWIGLELNLLSFIPLICISSSPYYSEAALKYFLIQAVASTMIVMSSSLQFFSESIYPYILILSLLMKLGAAPFHFWFPQVMEGLSWSQASILLSIQKLAPFYLISFLTFNSWLINLIFLSSILSSAFGALGGFNSLKLRKILAYSSINHMAWMLLAVTINEMLFFSYYLFYIVISFTTLFLFSLLRAVNFNELLNSNFMSPAFAFLVPISLFSLGGLPPFTGFIPKWIMTQMLMNNNMYMLLMILFSSALVTLFFYIRICIPFILMIYPSMTLNFKYFKATYKNFMVLAFIMFNFISFFLPFPFLLL